MIALGSPFAQDAGQDSEATDVSESSSAWIVGWAHMDEEDEDLTIFCSGGTNIRAFRVRPDGTSMTELVAPENENRDESEGDNANAWGYGVNASGEAMGYVRPCENDSACFGEIDPASWSAPTTSIEMDSLELYDPPDGDHFALGMNDAGNGVGHGWSLPSPGGGPPTPVCGKHAGFWESDAATPVNLGEIGLLESEESRANAVNDPDGNALTVVGDNTTQFRAWIWKRDSSAVWNASDSGLPKFYVPV